MSNRIVREKRVLSVLSGTAIFGRLEFFWFLMPPSKFSGQLSLKIKIYTNFMRIKAFCEAIFFSDTYGKLKPRPLTFPFLAIYTALFTKNWFKKWQFENKDMKITFVFTLFLQFILINIKTIQMLLSKCYN